MSNPNHQEPKPQLPPHTTSTSSTAVEEGDDVDNNITVVCTSPPFSTNPHCKSPAHQPAQAHTRGPFRKPPALLRYMECLKNHAAPIGGHATDGCCEFMAGGAEGTLEALKCSACNCHRNFHRKVHMLHAESSAGKISTCAYDGTIERTLRCGNEEAKKRFRTKFSQQQKEKMIGFAENVGWKLSNTDEGEVRRFCEEIGVNRKVLKVWMHNNKYHHSKKNKTPSTN